MTTPYAARTIESPIRYVEPFRIEFQREAPSAFRAFAHRLSPRRQRPHFHLQLALCPPERRDHDSAPRRHRRRAQHRRVREFHLRRTEVARSRLGRRIQAIRALDSAPPDGGDDLREGPRLPRLHARAHRRQREVRCAGDLALQSRDARAFPRRERSPRRRREPFALRFRVPREPGETVRSPTPSTASNPRLAADIEDFALLRSDGMPTYHLASCADDADLRISHIIRGQDHLIEHVQARPDLRSAGVHAAAVRASAPAGRARRNQALEAPPWSGRQRHHLSRRRISARSLHQLSVPARLVAQERSRTDDASRS